MNMMSTHPVVSGTGLMTVVLFALGTTGAGSASAQTTLRILPGEGTVVALGQRFDIRVEATGADPAGAAPRGLRVEIDDRDVTSLNILDPGVGREAGAGGTGSTRPEVPEHLRASPAPSHTSNFLLRERSFEVAGRHTITARTADGAEATVTVMVEAWQGSEPTRDPASRLPRVRNVILLLGDGMGIASRTAARVLSRGLSGGKANGLLAMDRMEATGLVMTSSLNSVITDSAPGMSALSTGSKGNNNQVGVYPDNTIQDPFDNPRIEYIGEFLRRLRGEGFNVGIVTTADVADATPAGNAVHSANRSALPQIARLYLAERETNAVSVLMGGGSRHFTRPAPEGSPHATLLESFVAAGYQHISTASEVTALMSGDAAPPEHLLGLFHPTHMNVAFDKRGQGRYSEELADRSYDALRDQPMLDELTRLALASLSAHSPEGFYLMVEGASIDKQAHAADAERAIWETIEFDRAVAVALEFAERTNKDDDPDNETLVVVAADHETGGFSLVAVGNERYDPAVVGTASRDYAAVYRFEPTQTLDFFTNYPVDDEGFPLDPDPSRKLLVGWAAGPDRFENWMSNRRVIPPAGYAGSDESRIAVANPLRDGPGSSADNRTVEGVAIPGFLVPGVIENGALGCPDEQGCPDDTAAMPQAQSGHTASDVPISASGPGALQFTGTFDNTDVFIKMLRAVGGSWDTMLRLRPSPGGTGREP